MIVAGSGHSVSQEAADVFNAQVMAFLDEAAVKAAVTA